MNQKDAAKMGPKRPTPQKAAAVAEARQELERIDRNLPKPEAPKRSAEIVRRHLGGEKRTPTPLGLAKKAIGRLTPRELAELRRWLDTRRS